MTVLDLYWQSNKNWYHYEGWNAVLNEDAPPEAKASYKQYLKQLEDIDRRTGRYLIIFKNEVNWDVYSEHEFDTEFLRSNDYFIHLRIPYGEYCALRKTEFTHFFAGAYDTGYEADKLIQISESIKDIIPKTWKVLMLAKEYGSMVFLIEDHIL